MRIGKKIGVKIRIAGVGSMKVPTNRRIMLINRKIIILLLVIPRTAAFHIRYSGKCHYLGHNEESPIIKVIVPVIFAESSTILGISLILIEP